MTDETALWDITDVSATSPDGQPGSRPTEFELVSELNAVIRGVNTTLVSAKTRDELAAQLCEWLADSPLYRAACMADYPTWTGRADGWTVAGVDTDEPPISPPLQDPLFESDDRTLERPVTSVVSMDSGQTSSWTVVPLSYDRTIYGALGLLSTRRGVGDRELDVLSELGSVIGHAINAVEIRRLVADTAVTELKVVSSDPANPLIEAAKQTACRFALRGLVPATEHGTVAYLVVENAAVSDASTGLEAVSDGTTRIIRGRDDETRGVVEWSLGADCLLGQLVDHGANVTAATASSEKATYTAEMASTSDIRTFLDCIQQLFPETRLQAKRELDRPFDSGDTLSEGPLDTLTDRQREALKAAYHAGYYRWPRNSTAEDVAETLDIAAPTLHGHLRKAVAQVLEALFDPDSLGPREQSR